MEEDWVSRHNSWTNLVAIEGPSGSGKSTLLRALDAELSQQDVPFDNASNNGAVGWSSLIRSLANEQPTTALALTFATAGARAQLREQAQRPLLCDRYVLSTMVYQRFAGVSIEYLYLVNEPLLYRTITVFLKVDPNELIARRQRQAADARTDWFKKKIDAAQEIGLYEEAIRLLQRKGHNVTTIDGAEPTDVLARKFAPTVIELLRAKSS